MNRTNRLIMALIMGFMLIGNMHAQTDNRLNGAWVIAMEDAEFELRLNNGNFEQYERGALSSRGTYTTTNEEILLQVTHILGSHFNALIGFSILDSRWYSVEEFIQAIRPIYLGLGVPESEFEEFVAWLVSPPIPPSPYAIVGNTLKLTATYEGTSVDLEFTRK